MIYLQLKEYEKLLAHAVKCLPEEACGLLGGKKDETGNTYIEVVYLLENTDKAYLRSLFRYIAARPDTDLNAVFAPHGGRRPFFRSLRELLTALLG